MNESLDPRKSLEALIEHFEQNLYTLKSPQYNETQARLEFINPFFTLLGWDMDNRQGYAEAYKDVIHEDAIKVGGYTKAPDYCFRIGGTRKFFVEAKKPSVNIKDDPEPSYQLRRYAWSAKLPLSILTDFEELAVYDCRSKPGPTDKPSIGRVQYINYRDYLEKWDEIASVFSREAVLKGSFDKYAESERAKRGTTEVDKAFLHEIEAWRDSLARNLALRNPSLSSRELNFAVQATIDRIIFLRICEDRGVEDYARLMALQNGENVYKRLMELFRSADERYNSGLFHFETEKGRAESPDELTPRLTMDDKVLKEIVKSLYYPESPYEFSVLPADILGQVYEQFLGKVIRLTAGHQAKVEDKPEVKKAGGVYYTPTYIVDYIVKNTVGKMLEGKTPKEISGETPKGAHPLRIADIACGSGSFLLGAYQYLLTWYRDRYVEEGPEKWAKGKEPRLYQASGGEWKLTTSERKRILLAHIYGVDIDSQAVEVTKLSLLLKVLEGETKESVSYQRRLFHERALPDLSRNIKCGNSLIGSDFFKGQQIALFDEEERTRINAFDWEEEFPEVFSGRNKPSGQKKPIGAQHAAPGKGTNKEFTTEGTEEERGFDVVIGNPPYGAFLNANEISYLRNSYQSTSKDLDTYGLFMERAIRLCMPQSKLSMIVPTGWYSGPKFELLRNLFYRETDPDCFVNLPYDIFDAWVDTTVFVATKRREPIEGYRDKPSPMRLVTFPKRARIVSKDDFEKFTVDGDFSAWFGGIGNAFLTYADVATSNLLKKMALCSSPLSEYADIQRGVTPFALTETDEKVSSRLAFTGTVRRYVLEHGLPRFIAFDESLAEPKPLRYFTGPRILLRELISRQFRLQAVYIEQDYITNKSMQSILPRINGPDIKYLLGVLNSRLISWFFLRQSNVGQRDDFPKIVLKETRSLPFHRLDNGTAHDEANCKAMVSLVSQMLSLQKKAVAARTEQDKTLLHRQITNTDKEIDRLVYALYGLTDDEIAIVENS